MTPQHDDEVQPYLVYRVAGRQLECALWTLETGQICLAMFLEQESAQSYVETNELQNQWQVYQPGREDLLKILRVCNSRGVKHAVLNPGKDQALRLFNLEEVLKNAEES